jgi:hypothetical protein
MINIHSLEACKIIALEKRKSEMGITSDAIEGRHSLGGGRIIKSFKWGRKNTQFIARMFFLGFRKSSKINNAYQ